MLIAFSLILLLLSVFLDSAVVALGLGISLSIIFNVHQDFYHYVDWTINTNHASRDNHKKVYDHFLYDI